MPELFDEGSRKARDHTVIGGEASAGFGSGIAAGECHYPGHALVLDQRQIEVRDIRERQLEHHLRAVRRGLEMPGQFREKDGFRPGLARALDRDFGLDDGHQPMPGDLPGHLELLRHHGSNAGFRSQVDDGAHLGAEHTEPRRPGEQAASTVVTAISIETAMP